MLLREAAYAVPRDIDYVILSNSDYIVSNDIHCTILSNHDFLVTCDSDFIVNYDSGGAPFANTNCPLLVDNDSVLLQFIIVKPHSGRKFTLAPSFLTCTMCTHKP